MSKRIDLNCDMGEGFSIYEAGDDRALLELVTSANIACGFHAGDPRTMAAVVKAAAARDVAIGAHPGLPDLQGFGRREMAISPAEAYDLTVYQVGALGGFTAAAGVPLHHVKAHGALYNMAARDAKLSEAIARAVRDVDPSLRLYALAGSVMVEVGRDLGLTVLSEVFADRSYQDDGSLTPRRQPGAMITDVDQSIAQVRTMVGQGYVRAQSGREVPIAADTLCLHGDQPGALAFAKALRAALQADGVAVKAPG
ncbi:MAG TPA: 5-oxoprolinase subunit PxpA [Burkholderiaceae bacterium]|nr:5-oxoprolinase subunit PxpA [Burkholderiaceae bacterium]